MGIVASNVKMLLSAYRGGVRFTETATLGRMSWFLTKDELSDVGSLYGADISKIENHMTFGGPADDFFQVLLGVESLSMIDNSSYEGANVIHDLNYPIPQKFEQAFDVVIDSGTLEHVFNFPCALANCMRMVKLNGTLFICVPANNCLGHGFYQLSPELFFRVFQESNGFQLKKIILIKHPWAGVELSPRQESYVVMDPKEIGERVCLIDDSPAQLMIEAKRVAISDIFSVYPQQSSYANKWDEFKTRDACAKTTSAQKGKLRMMLKTIFNHIPRGWQNNLTGYHLRAIFSIRNRHFYRKLGSKI